MSEPQSPQIPQPTQPVEPPKPAEPNQPPKPASSKLTAWVVGGVLILVGVIFIIQNVAGFFLHNWWALFILIPAFGSLGTAYTMFKKNDGKFTAASRGPLIGGVILLFIVAIFIFELNWGTMWPILLIIAGVGTLLTVMDKK